MAINGWRAVWMLAVYDCPMTQPEQRHDYSHFRRALLRENFLQLQYSLYVRHFPTMASAQSVAKRIVTFIPEGAKVAFFFITDKQFEMTKEYFGVKRIEKTLSIPEQVELF